MCRIIKSAKKTQGGMATQGPVFADLVEVAENGDASAAALCGQMLLTGDGVAADKEAALGFFIKAAQGGDAGAAFNAAQLLFAAGKAAEAVDFYTLAADAEHADAQFNLGEAYREGTGVEADTAKALGWLARAAKNGHRDAAHNLKVLQRQDLNGDAE
jgi:TPR repeat protein